MYNIIFPHIFPFQSCEKLTSSHPEEHAKIQAHKTEVTEKWNDLNQKAQARKAKLLDSYDFQRYLSDYRFDSILYLAV